MKTSTPTIAKPSTTVAASCLRILSLRPLLCSAVAAIALHPTGLCAYTTTGGHTFPDNYCTTYAALRFDQAMSPSPGVNWGGHAKAWIANAKAKGWNTTTDPHQATNGAAIVWDNGGTYGHVGTFEKLEIRNEGGKSVTYVVISEMNWGPLSPAGNTNGITTMFGKVSSVSLRIDALSRGTYKFTGFVLPRPNRPPVINSVSAWASTGTMTVTGATSDPDSDPIMQLDTWVIDDSTGAAVSGSIARSMQGSFTPGSFRISWTPAFLTARIAKSGYYKIGLRSLDNRNGKVETTSAPFWYDRPLPGAPEIDIVQNGTSRPSGGNASLFRAQVNTTCSATLTIQNTGKSNLTISSWSTNNSRFSASLSTTTIKPGYSGTITVRFTPGTSGFTYGALAIQNNDTDESRYLINLVGYGIR